MPFESMPPYATFYNYVAQNCRMDPWVGSGHDFAGFWLVRSALRIFLVVIDYFLALELI